MSTTTNQQVNSQFRIEGNLRSRTSIFGLILVVLISLAGCETETFTVTRGVDFFRGSLVPELGDSSCLNRKEELHVVWELRRNFTVCGVYDEERGVDTLSQELGNYISELQERIRVASEEKAMHEATEFLETHCQSHGRPTIAEMDWRVRDSNIPVITTLRSHGPFERARPSITISHAIVSRADSEFGNTYYTKEIALLRIARRMPPLDFHLRRLTLGFSMVIGMDHSKSDTLSVLI